MEIGPIPGIRSIQPVQSRRIASDLSGVFRVEFQREQQERYTPHKETSERGIEEDESAENDTPDGDSGRSSFDESGDRQVSFFA